MDHAPLRRRVAVRALVPDVLAVTTGIVVYFGIRGLTDGAESTAVDHAHDVLRIEQAVGLDVEDEVQAALVHLEPVATVANWVYIWGHWPAIVATLVWLALRHRVVFRRLRNAMLVSGAMGLCIYTTYPVAPPRLAGLGLVDTVSERSHSYRVLQPPAFVNQYAAMPSLHVGWDLLVGLALLAVAGSVVLRVLGVAMPLAMAASTVVTANHYVLDVLVGAAFGMAGWAVALWLEQRREARPAAVSTAPAAPRPTLPPPPPPPPFLPPAVSRPDGLAVGHEQRRPPATALPCVRGAVPQPRRAWGGEERRVVPRCEDRR
ncbi:MAG: phosphatase family protein [Frankiales bacterium]|nr:phosphatase family protein [Frankiales bacterium]